MSQPDLMSPGGAIWCEQHRRWECRRRSKRSQTRCHAIAISGTDSCFTHAGKSTKVAKAQGEAVTAWSALSGKATISHTEAVLGMLQMSWLRVHLYAGLLEQQVREAQKQVADAEPDTEAAGDGDDSGQLARRGGHGAGLIGKTLSASPGIGVYVGLRCWRRRSGIGVCGSRRRRMTWGSLTSRSGWRSSRGRCSPG
jgi:hypothetical protein